jgi:DNA-binding beta-propeller fold protein YncE
MIDGDNDVTDTIIVVTGPMGTASNLYNGPVYVRNINSNTVYGIGETAPPLQGIVGSVNNMKIQIQQDTRGSANDQSDISYSCEFLYQCQSTNQNSNVVS